MIIDGNYFQINFNKKYGQNFITDKNLLAAIAEDAGVTQEDTVIEIGAGAGTLTAALSDRAKSVIAYEIDDALRPVLEKTLASRENVRVVFEDFLKKSEPLPHPFKVVANLPYYVTTPIVMRLLEGEERPESVTVMVQKEVAERLTAAPGTAEYGAITASLDLVANAEITRIVGRQCFMPPPNVDSAVVRIDLTHKGYTEQEIACARKIIRAAFNMRRKTLSNGLASLFGGKEGANRVIEKAGFSCSVRGETLSAADYVLLARAALALGLIG
ncbi:MAG TPA: 16S rRNA (adenine(1518)-N(6)/adenine(1519)-N(6))-dimethyltransferase [Clostridiales bacterium]|nr:16S rRNA (adenine(1518)-N(6)/adenine(1519)-N(6))-dimethyltransferase [Clostridiales bacterium]